MSELRITHPGTLQMDRNVITKIVQQTLHIVFALLKSFHYNLGQSAFKSLALQNRIGFIAVDEAHLHLMKHRKVTVVYVQQQQQQGTKDSGIFAIAYAVSLASGKIQ